MRPFVVTGVLSPIGTPVDKTVHVTLAGIEAIHLAPAALANILKSQDAANNASLRPSSISMVLLGLESKMAVFTLQRAINNYPQYRLMATMPGVALAELWQLMGMVENVLIIISVLVLISSLIGLSVMLLSSKRERRREIAVLRIIGASPFTVFSLIMTEVMLLVSVSVLSALGLLSLTFVLLNDWLSATYGLFIDANLMTPNTLSIAGIIVLCSAMTTLLPAIDAYRTALQSNLSTDS